jgi:hypothetical protein
MDALADALYLDLEEIAADCEEKVLEARERLGRRVALPEGCDDSG